MSTVSQILDRKGGMVLSVEMGETVFDAISLMAEVNIGAVLVQQDDTIAGIFTERDYLQKVALKSLTSKNVSVVMSCHHRSLPLNRAILSSSVWKP